MIRDGQMMVSYSDMFFFEFDSNFKLQYVQNEFIVEPENGNFRFKYSQIDKHYENLVRI